MKWLQKLSRPGQPGLVGIEVWVYGLVALILGVVYLASRR